MDEVGAVEYEYQGHTWSFPGEMVELQVKIARADADCRAAVVASDDAALSDARAKRLRLVLEKYRRAADWWATFKGYDRWQADWALQAYARSLAEFGDSRADA